jgi:hypothetical protein
MSASYTFDKSGFYSNDKTCIIQTDNLYILGIINSKACDYFLKSIASTKQGGYFEYKPMYVSRLPIPKVDKITHDEIVRLVDTMLALNKEKQQTTLPEKLEALQHRIQYTDAKINQLVYQLYGLTEAEIALIENA